jgi:outer membrane cobalamin receptor
VQQGPCSTRFGSDALGGAVALYSAGAAPAGVSGELRGAVGTNGIRKGGISLGYGYDSGWVRAAVSAERENQVLDPANPYRTVSSYFGLGQQVGEDSLATLNYYNHYAGVPLPVAYADYGTAPRPDYDYSATREDRDRTQVLSGTWRTQFNEAVSAELTLGQVLQERLEPDYLTGQPTDPYSSRRNQLVARGNWRPSEAGSLSVGLDASDERAATPDLTDTTQLTGTARHLALLVEGERALGHGLRAVASVRTEHDQQSAPDGSGGDASHSITQTTGKAGLNWTLPAGFRVYASAGTGFSNPLLYNAMFNSVYGGTPLDNEKSHSYQLGASRVSGPWSASLDLSRTLYSNLVYYDYNGGVPIPSWGGYLSGIYRNGSQIRVQSAVVKAGYRTDAWGVEGFYRNQEARDLLADAGQQLTTSAVLRRPFQSLGLNAFRVLGAVRLEGRWSWIGPKYDAALPQGMGDKTHFNDLSLSAAWAVRSDLTVTLRGDHLMQPRVSQDDWINRRSDFQNDASQIFGYPAQAPTGTLEVRYRF